MDVTEDNWMSQAMSNVDRYLNRGGESQGDKPQLLKGTQLLNTIGIAMGLPIRNPADWTHEEFVQAENGNLCFFVGTSLEAIQAIVDMIIYCCDGDSENFITVLPVELYFQDKLYELPIFRVSRYKDSHRYYVDNAGRYYKSFDDWYNNNKLPPGLMLYPYRLVLSAKSNGRANCYYAKTPSDRADSKTARAVDTTTAVVGIGSSVGLLFASGGLAAPLVIAGVASAAWGTGRASYQLVDRASHGEKINPFTDSQSRMLWLGVAANIASFGAMGATMRLSSMAARAKDISSTFRLVTNIANGTNLTLSTVAILNTTIHMILHKDELTKMDVLFHLASVAFWTKGVFSYKTSGAIIRDAQNQVFNQIYKELPPEQRKELAQVREVVQNDVSLLRQFYSASQSNISIQEFSNFLVEAMHYSDSLQSLSPEQIEAFASLRGYLRDDLNLISGLQRYSEEHNLNRQDTLNQILNMWRENINSGNVQQSDIRLSAGTIIMGRAPPIDIQRMPELSAPMIRFVGQHLSQIDTAATSQWSISRLLTLQGHGLFTLCPITGIAPTGHSVVILNNHLHISIFTLSTLPAADCQTIFRRIGELRNCNRSGDIPRDISNLCVRDNRWRFEVHRNESVQWMNGCVNDPSLSNLTRIVNSNLLPHEKDRLYTFKANSTLFKVELYMNKMMQFVSAMEPRNISEIVAYSEFVIARVEETIPSVEKDLLEGRKTLPRGKKKSVWLREEASKEVFQDVDALKQKLEDLKTLVNDNNMVGVETVEKGLSDDRLVQAIRSKQIKFGGKISAAYHIFKHATDPPSDYVNQANRTMRSSSSTYTVSVGQEGDTRIISFSDENGSCIVLEKDGRVLLCSFRATGRS
ncbi:uncharacterized protein LOC126971353 isoform X1 [Leptidea sinapis]|uniref:uncharacterized protein LOC126971353 isoform X1 n=1 Tax=Leptidea sinapis TaxID=189913 RepID=UPI00212813EE|nr:uncharacterized protein LOC126971353 isoform X1 [Leptidea sinapis]XP_050673586.1 uncharacterized protein LOC126971353 isoform X1 [Leptidea sinapis]